jgi:hypothetical protein
MGFDDKDRRGLDQEIRDRIARDMKRRDRYSGVVPGAVRVAELRRDRTREDRGHPDSLVAQVEPDSAAMDYCVLTATMGNMARTRLLWLRDEVASSLKLYPDYHDTNPTSRIRPRF